MLVPAAGADPHIVKRENRKLRAHEANPPLDRMEWPKVQSVGNRRGEWTWKFLGLA